MTMQTLRLFLFLLFLLSPFLVWAETNEEGLAYLEKNKNAEGVVVLPSGLQYKVRLYIK
jgi:hypothetical protein